jgi:hypothetical protein
MRLAVSIGLAKGLEMGTREERKWKEREQCHPLNLAPINDQIKCANKIRSLTKDNEKV